MTQPSTGQGKYSDDTIMVITRPYTFVPTRGMCNPKSEPACEPWTLGDDDDSVWVHQL